MGARLNLVAKQQAKKLEQAQQHQIKDIKAAANPTIDERSQLITRPGEVSDRLYNEHYRQKVIRRQRESKFEVNKKYDPNTGQKLGVPTISKKSRQIAEQRMYATAVAQTREKLARGEAVYYSEDGKSIGESVQVAKRLDQFYF